MPHDSATTEASSELCGGRESGTEQGETDEVVPHDPTTTEASSELCGGRESGTEQGETFDVEEIIGVKGCTLNDRGEKSGQNQSVK